MELIVEILMELYLELMLLIVPEERVSKRTIALAKIIAIGVILMAFGLLIWGIYLITDRENMWGILPIVGAGMISLAQILLGFFRYKKHHR